jgi:capsular polysaccharide biosynthesis protein
MDNSDSLEIDLGKYLEILIRQWRLIAGVAFVCALAVAVYILSTPTSYKASVLIATTKIASSVTFGSTIETLSEGQLPVTLVDRKARLQSYVALVSNPQIAETVYQELKGDFGDKFPDPATLLRMVSGTILSGSDAVEITVKNGDPVLAQALVTAWGKHYVDSVNNLYANGSNQETILKVQEQANEAHTKYVNAAQVYSDYLRSSPQEEYQRIREDLIRLNRLLGDAMSLLEQVEAGGDGAAASNALAVSILKTQVFASHTAATSSDLQANPLALQFQASTVSISTQDLVADLKSLVNTLENRGQAFIDRTDFLVQGRSQPVTTIVEPSQSTPPVSATSIHSTVEDKIRLLSSLIELEERQKNDLTLTRDLAWDAYKNLATKETELIVASQTGGQEVVLGSTASVTLSNSSLIRNVILAALVGVGIGVFLAFFIEFWWGYKGREPHTLLGWNLGGKGGNRG